MTSKEWHFEKWLFPQNISLQWQEQLRFSSSSSSADLNPESGSADLNLDSHSAAWNRPCSSYKQHPQQQQQQRKRHSTKNNSFPKTRNWKLNCDHCSYIYDHWKFNCAHCRYIYDHWKCISDLCRYFSYHCRYTFLIILLLEFSFPSICLSPFYMHHNDGVSHTAWACCRYISEELKKHFRSFWIRGWSVAAASSPAGPPVF